MGEPRPDEETPNRIDLTDAITGRLVKAEAIARLLINKETAQKFPPAMAWTLADLIHEARGLSNQVWARIR